METGVNNISTDKKTFLQLSLAVAASSAELNEMYRHRKLLEYKITKTDSLYLDCLKRNMQTRIKRQLDHHTKLMKALKLKAKVQ